jgi:hypothetical protein
MMAAKRNKGSALVAAAITSFIASLAGIFFLTYVTVLANQVDREINDTQSQLGKSRSGEVVAPQSVERHESFADFLCLSDKERDPILTDSICYWTPDTLNGRVHSNDTIWIASAPIDRPAFMRRVTNVPLCIMPPYNHARFDEGWGYHPPVIFPENANELRNYSGFNIGSQGPESLTQLTLSGDNIYFRKCGKIRINGVDKIHCTPALIGENFIVIPPSGAIFVDGKVWISAARGRVDRMDGAYPESLYNDGNFVSQGFSGLLTIGSSDTMIICDDLIYQHANADNSVPSTMDSCADILGLISENWIMVGRRTPNITHINAAMVALHGGFSVQDIYCWVPPGWDNEKQSLFFWGSIAQLNRGIIHSHEPSYHLRGFIQKDYHYDVRFADNRPLYFPLTGTTGRYRLRYISGQND